ncbi:SapC family protein [Microvirga sp. SRT01]|uniref:SapC family protein n=1 Tax=Sphingomonas longa TaxID=2778730 RepID=A0ABS2D994_9SPHN|nr:MULTISPECIES: SapC family protein [Alphaproteobacteria]MBM6577468.1 SapC family protein [Sphingomonas sp. BT552]MBR7710513.1 SapC family protein [Microvirga sp. SRT01]
MSRIRPLDPAHHGALRFDPGIVASTPRFVQIGLSEIVLAAADMPLCLAKDAHTGRFNLIALLGLVEPQNLFCVDGRFHATYCPRALQLTGFRLHPDGVAGLAIDEEDPALGASGQLLFENGRATPLTATIADALRRLIADLDAARDLIADYAARHLIRPLRLTLRRSDQHEHVIDGLYTIDQDALSGLSDADVVILHRADRLAPATLLSASLTQIERLCQLDAARHQQDRFHATF